VPRADLNIDLGELPDEPPELYSLAHRVNIACGGHAGDEASMRRACELAKAAGARVGAHPSYPDRENFGRAPVSMSEDSLLIEIFKQCTLLWRIAADTSVPLEHVKPHGALYHTADQDPSVARLIADVAYKALGQVAIICSPGQRLEEAALRTGLTVLTEGFADRGYTANGQLIARGMPGALIEDPATAAAQARTLAAKGLKTICVHSDTPNAVAIARAVRAALDAT
jgi:UPF0271 protein